MERTPGLLRVWWEHHTTYADRRWELRWELRTKKVSVPADEFAEHVHAVETARSALGQWLTYRTPPPQGVHWLAVLLAATFVPALSYAAWRAYRWTPPAPAVEPDASLQGVSLGIVLLGMRCYLSPLTLGAGLLESRWVFSRARWEATPAVLDVDANWYGTLVLLETLISLAFVLYSIVLAVSFHRRKRSFRTHFTVLNTAIPAWLLADSALSSALMGDDAQGTPVQTLFSIVVAIAFVLYVGTSPRVAARFVV